MIPEHRAELTVTLLICLLLFVLFHFCPNVPGVMLAIVVATILGFGSKRWRGRQRRIPFPLVVATAGAMLLVHFPVPFLRFTPPNQIQFYLRGEEVLINGQDRFIACPWNQHSVPSYFWAASLGHSSPEQSVTLSVRINLFPDHSALKAIALSGDDQWTKKLRQQVNRQLIESFPPDKVNLDLAATRKAVDEAIHEVEQDLNLPGLRLEPVVELTGRSPGR